MKHLSSGVTVLDGRGGYTGNHQKVISSFIDVHKDAGKPL